MEKITIDIIGGGRIGRMHAGTIYTGMQDVTIKYVSDLYPQAAQQWGPMYGVQNVVSDAEIVFNDPEVQAVLFCTSTDTHADYIIRAAECGKDIYCEKPIDLSVAKIERALAAVEKAGVRLQIGFNRRFDWNFRRAYEAIQAGEIGKPLMIRITNRDATPPPEAYIKVSGGMLLDMSIHDFDLCRYFAGSEAESVYCTGACNLVPYIGANGDVDTAVTVINFKNGCTAVVDNSRQTGHGMECRVEIMGTEGNLVTGNEVENTLTIGKDNGLKQDGLACDFFARFKNSFPVILGTFFDSIRNNTPTVTTGRDGLETMLDTAAELGIETLEITTGGYSSAPHLDLDKLLSSADAWREYLHAIESRGLKLETLNCNGNQLSPDETGARDVETVEKHVCDLNRSHESAPYLATPAYERSWTYCALGYGHDVFWWKRFIMALTQMGHDGAMSLEIEDVVMPSVVALSKSVDLLKEAIPRAYNRNFPEELLRVNGLGFDIN